MSEMYEISETYNSDEFPEPDYPEPSTKPMPGMGLVPDVIPDNSTALPTYPMSGLTDEYKIALRGGQQIDAGGTPVEPQTPVQAPDIHGPFDAFMGRVLKTYWGSTHPVEGVQQAIDVERINLRWGTNNWPVSTTGPQAKAEPTVTLARPFPFIPRADQAAYHVAVNDIVTVVQSKDGKSYYFSDELPFLATVETITESSGTYHAKVRRQAITGNPGATFPTLADQLDADGVVIEYSYVLLVGPHPDCLEVNDLVIVHRRGAYLFISTTGSSWGVAQIDALVGGGVYTITEQVWDAGTSAWQDVTIGAIGVAATDISKRTTGAVNDYVIWWQERDDTGSLETFINLKAQSLPPGGLTYQLLQKQSNTNYDAIWDWARGHA